MYLEKLSEDQWMMYEWMNERMNGMAIIGATCDENKYNQCI